MENETREVTYLAVSLILISVVLGFISFGLGLMTKMSDTRNSQLAANERLEDFRSFNAYDSQTIIGDEAIELIRQHYDSGVTIFVDYRKNEVSNKIVNASNNRTCSYCSGKGGDHRIYNEDMWLLHRAAPDNINYFFLSTSAVPEDGNDMRNWFKSKTKYRCYLVYNSQDPKEFYNELMNHYDAVKGSASTETAKLMALDSGVKPVDPSSRITGIVLVSYVTLGIPVV